MDGLSTSQALYLQNLNSLPSCLKYAVLNIYSVLCNGIIVHLINQDIDSSDFIDKEAYKH